MCGVGGCRDGGDRCRAALQPLQQGNPSTHISWYIKACHYPLWWIYSIRPIIVSSRHDPPSAFCSIHRFSSSQSSFPSPFCNSLFCVPHPLTDRAARDGGGGPRHGALPLLRPHAHQRGRQRHNVSYDLIQTTCGVFVDACQCACASADPVILTRTLFLVFNSSLF